MGDFLFIKILTTSYSTHYSISSLAVLYIYYPLIASCSRFMLA